MPNIGISPDMHLLETSLYFMPNCRQVTWNLNNITLLSCLWPLAHYHCHHRHRHGRRCCFSLSCLSPHTSRDPLSLFVFLSGFQEDAECTTNFNFLGMDFGADFTFNDAFNFNSIDSGAFEYNNIDRNCACSQ
jgi:hypothetical protein